MDDETRAAVGAAFHSLQAALRVRADVLQQRSIDAFEQIDPAGVATAEQALADTVAMQHQVEALARGWQRLEAIGGQTAGGRRYLGRLPRGVPTPRGSFRLPLLHALEDLGGEAVGKDLMRAVDALVEPLLRPVDRLPTPSRPSTPRWRNAAHSARHDLAADGLIQPGRQRGSWALTAAGRAALAAAEAEAAG